MIQRKKNNAKSVDIDSLNKVIPVGLNATSGDLDGEIDLIWEPVRDANAYVIQVSRSVRKPETWIQQDIVTKSSYTVSRLKSKYTYWFRIAAVSSKGQSSWSIPVSKKAP